jgi:anaerobic selenocysteine-containing dehydrogenase
VIIIIKGDPFMHTVSSICPFCGVGCGMGLRVEDNRVVAVEPVPNHPVSQGKLCAKGGIRRLVLTLSSVLPNR